METDKILALFEDRRRECKTQQYAFDCWLGIITPLRWTAIVLGVILPAVAGVAVFSDIFNPEIWKIVCACILLVSSIVSGLHTALKCDSHQVECQRLSNLYSALADKYQEAQIEPAENLPEIQKELSAEFKQLKESTMTTPAQWCVERAERKMMNSIKPAIAIAPVS